MYMHMYVCMYVCIHVCMYVCMYVYVYAYTCTYTYIKCVETSSVCLALLDKILASVIVLLY